MSTRRRHSAETKLRVVKEALETGNGSIVARRHDLSSSMVNRWVRQYQQYGEAAFKGGSKSNGKAAGYSNKDYRKLEKKKTNASRRSWVKKT